MRRAILRGLASFLLLLWPVAQGAPVRGMKWGRVAELEMVLDGKKIVEYRGTARIYFDVER